MSVCVFVSVCEWRRFWLDKNVHTKSHTAQAKRNEKVSRKKALSPSSTYVNVSEEKWENIKDNIVMHKVGSVV